MSDSKVMKTQWVKVLWDASGFMHRGKCVTTNASARKEDWPKNEQLKCSAQEARRQIVNQTQKKLTGGNHTDNL